MNPTSADLQAKAVQNVMIRSEKMPEGTPIVRGYDFNAGIDYNKIFESFKCTGFQATQMGLAIEEINRMVR